MNTLYVAKIAMICVAPSYADNYAVGSFAPLLYVPNGNSIKNCAQIEFWKLGGPLNFHNFPYFIPHEPYYLISSINVYIFTQKTKK